MSTACPGIEQLNRLVREELPKVEEAAVLQHLDGCAACQQRLEGISAQPPWLKAVVQRPDTASSQLRLDELMKEFRSQPLTALAAENATNHSFNFLQPSKKAGVLGLLGSYEILEEIARGAMGIVFKARDTVLDRIVAIKVLAPALAHEASARTRFLREARAAAAIAHEHVVTIHAVEETREVPYLVMQFVPGKSLAERIRATGALRVDEVLRIGFQIASGLAAAHRLGLIHRDIKPSNILLEDSIERVKITDFGLARAVDDAALTAPGHVAGTPQYMAPEQARGESVDQRADLFSVGCVLYEMATGVSPFQAPTPLGAMRKVCDEEPRSACAINPAVPQWLSELIAGLLIKEPARRFGSAQQLADQLASHLAHAHRAGASPLAVPHAGTTVVSPRPPRRSLWPLTAAAAILVGAIIYWFSIPESGERFIVMSGSTGAPKRFQTLAEAVEAAPQRAVIEFQFNNELAVEPITLEKPLILRAAAGFKPVLVMRASTRPLLTTHAPLVVEGVTFKSTTAVAAGLQPPNADLAEPTPPPPQGSPPPGEQPRPAPAPVLFIQSGGSPLMAANCRFLIGAKSTFNMPKGPTAIRVADSPGSHFENCEFFGASGSAIECHWEAPRNGARITIRNCAQAGSEFVSLIIHPRMNLDLELVGNTVASDTLMYVGQRPETTVHVTATNNVFDVAIVHQRDHPRRPLTREILRWEGSTDIFAVRSAFARVGPARQPIASLEVRSLEDWRQVLQITDTSVEVPLRLHARLQDRVNWLNHAPANYRLTAEETNAVHKLLGKSAAIRLGADLAQLGPESFNDWRQGPRYQEWLALAREQGFTQ